MTVAEREKAAQTPPAAPPAPDPLRLAIRCARVAQEHRGQAIRVLAMGPLIEITDYFVLVTGTNRRQIRAIAEAIRREMRACGVRPLHVDGLESAVWVLADYGDFVVHIFQEEARAYYDLDGLWADAARIPWEEEPTERRGTEGPP